MVRWIIQGPESGARRAKSDERGALREEMRRVSARAKCQGEVPGRSATMKG